MIRIGVANQKGGVGKTTTSVSVGHGLAIAGYKVLIIDTDPQGHVATFLGLDKAPGLLEYFRDGKELSEVVTRARKNLAIIPGDKSSDKVVTYLKDEPFGEKVVVNRLNEDPNMGMFDVVIFDMAPSYDQLHIATLLASDVVIIPTSCTYAALDGLVEILATIKQVQAYGHDLKFRILPTYYNRIEREVRLQYGTILEKFPRHTWAPIPKSTEVTQSVAYGKTIWEYCPIVPAVRGYPSENKKNILLGGYANVIGRIQNLMEDCEGS